MSRQPARCEAPERYDFPVFLDPARLKAPADDEPVAAAALAAPSVERAASGGELELRAARRVARSSSSVGRRPRRRAGLFDGAGGGGAAELRPAAADRAAAGWHRRPLRLDFSGIGGTEFGLKAGFEQLGFGFELVQASEALSTKKGQHNAGVLRQRFPGVRVLSEEERTHVPFPEEARLAVVTPICSEHSPLKYDRDPSKTEALLAPLFARLAAAPWIVAIFFENVPEFLVGARGADALLVLVLGRQPRARRLPRARIRHPEHRHRVTSTSARG